MNITSAAEDRPRIHMVFPNHSEKCDSCKIRYQCWTDNRKIDLLADRIVTWEDKTSVHYICMFKATFTVTGLEAELIRLHADLIDWRFERGWLQIEKLIIEPKGSIGELGWELNIVGRVRTYYDFDYYNGTSYP